MSPPAAVTTLALSRPRGGVLRRAVVLLAVASLLGEIGARSRIGRRLLPERGYGTRFARLEIALARLDQLQSQQQSPECIVVGSSVVARGFDPDALRQGYRRAAGRDLRCFNFGFEGVSAHGAVQLAEIVVRRYRPALLVYGLVGRDVSEFVGPPPADDFANAPWVRYQQGHVAPLGWLTEHSQAFAVYLAHQGWTRANHHQLRAAFLRTKEATTAYGYFAWPLRRTLRNMRQRALPKGDDVSQSALEAIDRFAALQRQGVRVVFMEVPLPLSDGEIRAQRRALLATVGARAMAGDILLLRPPGNLVRRKGWRDPGHLNAEGARIFSKWAGEQVAAMATTHPLPVAARTETAGKSGGW